MKKIRICFISGNFYPTVGGAEKQAQRLSKKLIEKGLQIFIVTQRLKGLKDYEIINGISVYRAIRTIPLGSIWGITYMLSLFWFLIKRWSNYDIIHIHFLYLEAFIGFFIAKILRKKIVVLPRGSGKFGDLRCLKRLKFHKIFLKIFKKLPLIIAISKDIKEELLNEGFYPDRIIEISNGVDISIFHPPSSEERIRLRRSLLIKTDVKVVLYVGRLSPPKGLPCLLQAWQKVEEEFRETELILVGEGPLKEELQDLVDNLMIKVRFEGRSERPEDYFGASDVFVFPSLSEGMPNCLLEAMACGLPVVATKIGGNMDLIKDGVNGLLVEPEDPEELAEAILRLLKDDELSKRFGIKARDTIIQNYSLDSVADQYIEVYKNLLE